MRRLLSGAFLIGMLIVFVGCASTPEDDAIPTQIVLPTDAPTSAPTQTPEPTDIPRPSPTPLVIPRTIADNPNDQAYVSVVNASSTVGIVDVYIEALAIGTNLSYGAITEREPISAGRYTFRILSTGSFLTDPPLYEETLTIFGEQSLLFVISGSFDNLTITRLIESNEPLPNDTSRMMMVNALIDSDNLVMVVDDVPQTAFTPYLQISEVTTHPAQRVNLKFQNNGNTLLEQIFDLRERENYTFVVIGDRNQPDTIQTVVLTSEAPGLTNVSIINASPSIGLVDIYFADELIVRGASYGENSIPQPILSGTYDVSIYPELADPTQIEPIAGTQFIANPDELVNLVLVGEPGSLRFAIDRQNQQPTYDNKARMTFLNSLESVPTVLLQSNDETLNQRITFGRTSDTFEINVNQSYSFTWIQQFADSQDISLENLSDFVPEAGKNYLYIFAARGFDSPILLANEVGTLGFDTVDVPDETATPSAPPTYIRLINLWEEGLQLNARLDGTMVAEGIGYGLATNQLVIPSGEHTIQFSRIGDDTELISITHDFNIAGQYVVVAYGYRYDPEVAGDILLLDDTGQVVSPPMAGLRLIVLEGEPESLFGIGYSEPSAQLSQPSAEERFRRSLPLGIQQVIREIPDKGISNIERIMAKPYNIRIIDNEAVALTYTHVEYQLEPEMIYNIFLWENNETRQTTTVIVPYSSP